MPGAAGHGSATLAHRWRGYVAVAVVGGAALTGRTVAQAPSPPVDFWEAQWIGLTDDQKTAKIEGWQRLSEEATWQYLRAFFSEGRDLDGLASAAIEVDGYGPRSLDDAIEEAAVIVVGSVSPTSTPGRSG